MGENGSDGADVFVRRRQMFVPAPPGKLVGLIDTILQQWWSPAAELNLYTHTVRQRARAASQALSPHCANLLR